MSVRTSPRWNLAIGPRFQQCSGRAVRHGRRGPDNGRDLRRRWHIFAPRSDGSQPRHPVELHVHAHLSFELYAQPLVSNGDYGTPREFQRPREYDFKTYGEDIGTISQVDNSYVIDPDRRARHGRSP